MAIDTSAARSRRALLGAALGGAAAFVASAVSRPSSARAGVDGDVVLGGTNDSTTATVLRNLTTSSDVLDVTSGTGGTALSASSGTGIGLYGSSSSGYGVVGQSNSSWGVNGQSASSFGVHGQSDSTYGVVGATTGSWAGILGASIDGTGVQGHCAGGGIPNPPAKTGVFGYATQDASARGVYGQTTAGRGVYGQATTGYGVRGYATSGTAVYAGAADPMAGYALRAVGKVKLDQCAGVATIASGTKSVVVTPGIDLTSSSAVVASLMGSAGGTTTVHRSSVSTTANTFTIYLTANSTVSVKVAWHVFG